MDWEKKILEKEEAEKNANSLSKKFQIERKLRYNEQRLIWKKEFEKINNALKKYNLKFVLRDAKKYDELHQISYLCSDIYDLYEIKSEKDGITECYIECTVYFDETQDKFKMPDLWHTEFIETNKLEDILELFIDGKLHLYKD